MSLDRGTMGRLSVQRLSKRFSRNKEYDRVDDTTDTRVPLYNEEAFQHGLSFKAKFIGSLQINKPSSKLDIITAMRRIRYEFKVKGVKKQRCTIDVSTQGVKVMKRKRRRRKQQNEDQLFIMHHPIYRIFYVSHDSQDLKIFSYITREVPDNTFRCNVFKAYRKRMALHLVRSLGQAFDVCHKLNPRPKKKRTVLDDEKKSTDVEKNETNSIKDKDDDKPVEEAKEDDSQAQSHSTAQDTIKSSPDPFTPGGGNLTDNEVPPLIELDPLAILKLPPAMPSDITLSGGQSLSTYVGRPRPKPGQSSIQENPMIPLTDSIKRTSPSLSLGEPLTEIDGGERTSWETERQQLKAQMTLLTEQLHSETAARIESQARVEHLLMQNKELLSHLQKLMVQLQQLQSLQMSQITTPPLKSHDESTPSKVPDEVIAGDIVSDLTPPHTDASEPSSSEVHLANDSSPEMTRIVANVADEQPLINEDESKNELSSSPNQDVSQETHDQATIDAVFTSQESNDKSILDVAFTPQESYDLDVAFTPQESNDQMSLIDAAFLPQDQAKIDAGFPLSVTS